MRNKVSHSTLKSMCCANVCIGYKQVSSNCDEPQKTDIKIKADFLKQRIFRKNDLKK